MHTLTIDRDIFYLPHSWNELTPDQFLRLSSLGLQALPFMEFRVKVLLIITGLKVVKKKEVLIDGIPHYYLIHGRSRVYLVSVEALYEVSKTLEWIIAQKEEKGKRYYYINPRITRNLIPILPGNLHGPGDGLVNCVFDEFIRAQTNFGQFLRTGKPVHLDRLIATLYRPADPTKDPSRPDYDGDIREEFNDYTVEARVKEISRIKPELKNAVIMFYQGCFAFLDKKFPHVFNGEKSTTEDHYMGFMKLVNALAQNDVTKAGQVRRSLLYDVLVTLEELAIQKEMIDAKTKRK